MSIKKSFLEQNLFYKVAKVTYLLLPLLIAIGFILKNLVFIQSLFKIDFAVVIQAYSFDIIYAFFGLIAYYLIINWLFRLFLYIAYGGLEDDITKKPEKVRFINLPSQPAQNPNQDSGLGLLFLIILIIIIMTYSFSPTTTTTTKKTTTTKTTCIPTGCGNLWHSSCTNLCYNNSSDCQQTSTKCYGNVICRQCP